MKDRKRHTNESPSNSSHSEEPIDFVSVSATPAYTEEIETSSEDALAFSPTSSHGTKRKSSESLRSLIMGFNKERQERNKLRDEVRQKLLQEPDELKLFFDSMYAATIKLSSELQRDVKRKLFVIVSEAEDASRESQDSRETENQYFYNPDLECSVISFASSDP